MDEVHASAEVPNATPEVQIETPALLYWAFFIPTFFVVVWGMQKLLSPRVPRELIDRDDP